MSVPLVNAFYYKVLNRENKYSKTRFSTPFCLSYILKLHIGASITGHLRIDTGGLRMIFAVPA